MSNFFASTSNVPVQFAVCCHLKSLALNKEIPVHFLDGEAPFFMKVSKVGCHKKALVVLWGHTESFGEVKFMVVA